MQRFGEKLRTLREEKDLSMREFARQLGFATHAHISRIEAGKKPTLDFVIMVAQFFDVSFDQLMNDELELDN